MKKSSVVDSEIQIDSGDDVKTGELYYSSLVLHAYVQDKANRYRISDRGCSSSCTIADPLT